jgi:hypothetical protein
MVSEERENFHSTVVGLIKGLFFPPICFSLCRSHNVAPQDHEPHTVLMFKELTCQGIPDRKVGQREHHCASSLFVCVIVFDAEIFTLFYLLFSHPFLPQVLERRLYFKFISPRLFAKSHKQHKV